MMRIIFIILLLLSGVAYGEQPLPEFSTEHQLPPIQTPAPRGLLFEYLDVAVLVLALALAAYLAFKKRSRGLMIALGLGSLLYFGFWRQGCVCAIGAVQNCALTFADPEYAMPIVVTAFLLLPLVFALFFGRVFCSGVCPLGAVQDVVLIKPHKVPRWLAEGLSVIPAIYLGAAVLVAAMGGGFLICQYDPFISIFRLSGTTFLLLLGGAFVIISMFVGRPYCRFLCPYSVPLRWLSRVSKWHVTISPDDCVQCRLCEDACPFDAIRKPETTQAISRHTGKKRLAVLLMLLPVFLFGGGFIGHFTGAALARTNPTVRTADAVWQYEHKPTETMPDEVTAFRKTGQPSEAIYEEAAALRSEYKLIGWLLGAWVGLVIAGKLIMLSVRRTRTDYEADRGDCVACARCFASCPRERRRLKEANA